MSMALHLLIWVLITRLFLTSLSHVTSLSASFLKCWFFLPSPILRPLPVCSLQVVLGWPLSLPRFDLLLLVMATKRHLQFHHSREPQINIHKYLLVMLDKQRSCQLNSIYNWTRHPFFVSVETHSFCTLYDISVNGSTPWLPKISVE